MNEHSIVYKYPMRYPKINTLWMRDMSKQVKRKGVIMPGHYSQEEFQSIKYWSVSEKIHGENIRIFIDFIPGNASPPIIWIGGRNDTDTPNINKEVIRYIKQRINLESLRNAFTKGSFSTGSCPRFVMIFAEGYGGDIHHGHNYRDSPELVVFDIVVDSWWLGQSNVEDISEKLGLSTAPTYYSSMEIPEIVSYVESEPDSRLANKKHTIEGVVCRSVPLLLTRKGYPVMFKLKVKDFKDLKMVEARKQ